MSVVLAADANAQWSRFGAPPGSLAFSGAGAGQATVDSSGDLFVSKASIGNLRRAAGSTLWQKYSFDTIASSPQMLGTLPNGDLLAFLTGHGLYRSKDRGLTWHLEQSGITTASTFAADGAGSVIIAGKHLYRRSPADTGWILTTTTPNDSGFTEALAVANGVFMVGNGGHLYKSTNAGVSWIRADTGFAPFTTNGLNMDRHGNLLAISGQLNSAIYRSTNGGSSWSQLSRDIPSYGLHHLMRLRDGTLTISTAGNSSATNGTYLSRNDAANFGLSNLWGKAPFEVLQGPGNTIIGLTDEGMFESKDNMSTWQPIDSGFALASVKTLAKFGGDVFASMGSRGVARSTNGASWTFVNDSLVDDVYTLMSRGGAMYAYSQSEPFVYQGGMWHTLPQFFDPGTVTAGTIDAKGTPFIGGPHGLFYLKNQTWRACQDLLEQAIRTVVCDSQNNLYAWIGTSLYSSTDDGFTFPAFDVPNIDSTIVAIAANRDTFAVLTLKSIFRTSDHGATWSNQMLPTKSNIAGFGLHGNQTFIYNAKQVWESVTNSSPWVADSGFGKGSISYMLVSDDTTAYIGTADSGIYKRSLPALPPMTNAVSRTGPAPTIALWPNPSAGKTHFSNVPANVTTLTISTPNGEIVKRIAVHPIGGELSIDLELGAGSYFCTFAGEGVSSTEKLTIIH